MDITHFAEFGKLQFVHVSIDTASGVIFASLHTGEKARHVIAHCFEAWGSWSQPKELKLIMALLILPILLLAFVR